jgi:uncharacterized membrane protein
VPDIGSLHPQIVHFVIALLMVGVVARVLSLVPIGPGRRFIGGLAAALIFLGTAAAVVAVQSGHEAHESIEGIPGIRPAIDVHEDYGIDTRNIFLVVSVLEIGILAFATRKPVVTKGLRVLSALVGIAGLVFLFETGEHGGDLVYGYAGGVGTRTGDTAGVRRLLVAGLYNNAELDRKEGRPDAAAERIAELRRLMPNDTSVRLLYIQSLVRDRKEPQRALAALDSITVSPDNQRLRYQTVMLEAEALDLAGQRDSARALLTALKQDMPRRSGAIDRVLNRMR